MSFLGWKLPRSGTAMRAVAVARPEESPSVRLLAHTRLCP